MAGQEATNDIELVMNAMSSVLEVAESTNPLEHPRYSQFKNYGAEAKCQKERRSNWLRRQKEDRELSFNKRRLQSDDYENCADAVLSDEDNVDAEMLELKEPTSSDTPTSDNGQASSDKQSPSSDVIIENKPGSWRRAIRENQKRFCRLDLKGKLMYSEWLIHVPGDFANKWVMIPAPKGKRVSITMGKKRCQLYNKAGESLSIFSVPYKNSEVIFDGFVRSKVVYILDFIHCGPFEIKNCDFDCRRMIGKNFLHDNGILDEKNQPDKWTFVLLEPTADCHRQTMEAFMAQLTSFQLDGLMFYHREGLYTSGITPLVGWLKPWMMSDILQVPINPVYMIEANGATPQEFMDDFARNHSTYAQVITKKEFREREKMDF